MSRPRRLWSPLFNPRLERLEGRDVPAFIYVDPTFTGSPGGNPDQDFNAGGVGPLGTVSRADLTFVLSNTQAGPEGVNGAGKFAVRDLTTAFNSARDNPGADTILLSAAGTFPLDNSQGRSLSGDFGGFNDNTYFFNRDPLSILGSGQGVSVIRPLAGTVLPEDPASLFDPVFAVRQGADFVGSDFTFDGSAGAFGGGIGASAGTDSIGAASGTDVTLTRVTIRNFLAQPGEGGGAAGSLGYGLFVNPNAGGFVTVADSTFANIGRDSVGFLTADGQVLNSTFTGRGGGDFVDYGVQVIGVSRVYVAGSTFTGFQGQSSADKSESAAVNGSQDVDPETNTPIPGGAALLVVGNRITGNRVGVAVGNVLATGKSTSQAEVRFNDLSGNVRALDAAVAAPGPNVAINAPNNFFGTPASPVADNGGNVLTPDRRPVLAPTIAVASGFGTAAAPTLAAAGPAAAQAYVTDPRIQSPVTIGVVGTQPAPGDVTFLVTFADRLVNQDKTLFSASYLPTGSNASFPIPSGQLTVGAPVDAGAGSTVTVTVPGALLVGGRAGRVTLTLAPSSGSAGTGNAQLAVNGFQTAAASGSAQYAAPVPPTITGGTFATRAGQPVTFLATVTVDPRGTVASVTAGPLTQGAGVVTVGGTLTQPTFTFTPAAGFTGTAAFVARVTDSFGQTAEAPVSIAVDAVPPTEILAPDRTFGPVVAGQPLVVGAANGLLAGVPNPTGNLRVLEATPSVGAGTLLFNPDGSFTFTPAADRAAGPVTFTYRLADGTVISNLATATVSVTAGPPLVVTARFAAFGTGAGVRAQVRVTRPGLPDLTLFPFEDSFRGGVRVAVADLTGDGTDDVAVAAGPTGGPRITVYDGRDGTQLANFFAFEETFRGGAHVAAADSVAVVNGQRVPTSLLVVGAGSFGEQPGDPRVRAFRGVAGLPQSGTVGVAPIDYYAYSKAFQGGVRVAAGDLAGDGRIQIVTIAGPSGGPDLRVWDPDAATGIVPQLRQQLLGLGAGSETYRGGAFVAVSAGAIVVTPDSLAEFAATGLADAADSLPDTAGVTPPPTVITNATVARSPQVAVFLPAGQGRVAPAGVLDLGEPGFLGGVRVAAGTAPGGGAAAVLVADGPGGQGRVRQFAFRPQAAAGATSASLAQVVSRLAASDLRPFPAVDPAVSVYVGLAPLPFVGAVPAAV